MQDIDADRVAKLIPRALELHRERAWKLIRKHPEVIGLKRPIPADVEHLLKKHEKDLEALRRLQASQPRLIKERGPSIHKGGYKKRPPKFCKYCKVMHSGKEWTSKSHHNKMLSYRGGTNNWNKQDPEERMVRMNKMSQLAKLAVRRKAIDSRMKTLRPEFVNRIGVKRAREFINDGLNRYGKNFLIKVPTPLIKQITTLGQGPSLSKFIRTHGISFEDFKASIMEAIREKEVANAE